MYDQQLDPVNDPALVEILAGRIQMGQTFDEVVAEGHSRFNEMTLEQLSSLRNLVENRTKRKVSR